MEDNLQEPVIASQPSRETESVSSLPCAICRRQFSRYACPRCNIPYCSLVCFRSEKHADCSESFYRKELELDVKNAPSASVEEKRRMIDLLKRFEEDALDDSPLLGGGGLDDEDGDGDAEEDLHKRLQNIDLDSASYEELWSALSPAEREDFLQVLNDPSSELAQRLLASEELEKVQADPWWDAPHDAQPAAFSSSISSRQGRNSKPFIMSMPETLVKQSSNTAATGPLLLYNLCALCVAYAYAIRHYAVSPLSSLAPGDPDYAEIRRSISQLVPFLPDRKSTMMHISLSSVVTDMWSRFPPGHMNQQFFSLLLRDAASFLRPATVTVVASSAGSQDLEGHRSANALRVVSDVASLYGESPLSAGTVTAESNKKARPNHVVHKLTFYAAYIIGTPAPMLRVLADEATMRAKVLDNEGKQGGRERSNNNVKRVNSGNAGGTPTIEEL